MTKLFRKIYLLFAEKDNWNHKMDDCFLPLLVKISLYYNVADILQQSEV